MKDKNHHNIILSGAQRITKRVRETFTAVVLVVLTVASTIGFARVVVPEEAQAAIPKIINFQGKLTNVSDGTNVPNGNYTFEFKLYSAVTGGSLLWTETWDGSPSPACDEIAVINGVFNAKLGQCASLASVDFSTGSLYLSVNFDDGSGFDGEMSPRKQLVSSAFAFVANSVNGDGTINTANQSATALTVGRTSTNAALQVDTNTASSTTGLKITSAAAGSGTELTVISSGTNENLTLDAKGSGTVSINGTATGDILLGGGSGSTGCTVTNSTGALACASNISSAGVLQAGGVSTVAYSRLGTGTTNHSLNAANDLLVSDALEVNGDTFLDGNATVAGTLTLTNDLSVANGGTGASTFTANGVLYGNGTGAIGATAAGTTGQCLIATTAAAPSWGSCSTGGVSWSGLTAPTGSLSLAHGANTTAFTFNSVTTASAFGLSSSSLSSGTLLDLGVNSTAAASNSQRALNVSTAGANSTSSQTTYGGYFSNIHSGASSTNIAAYFTASGGTNNYSGIFNGGNVGIGTTTPNNLSGSYFGNDQINPLWVSANNASAVTALVVQGNLGQAIQFVDETGVGTADFGVYGTELYFVNRQSGPIRFQNGSNVGIFLSGSGNVRIGNSVSTVPALFTVGSSDQFQVNSSGVVTAGTWNGTALTDAYVSDTLTSSLFVGSGSTTTAIDLATAEVAGTLPVNRGGSGAATLTSNGVLYGSGTSAIQATAQGGANTVLVANGGAPSFSSAITVGTSVTSPTINATSALQFNGANINTGGTLSNVAYLDQANTFTQGQTLSSTSGSALALDMNSQTNVYAINITNQGAGTSGIRFDPTGSAQASIMGTTGGRFSNSYTNSGGLTQGALGNGLGIADDGAFRYTTDANAASSFESVMSLRTGGTQKLLMGLDSSSNEVFSIDSVGDAIFNNLGLSGTITGATGITSSGTITFSGLGGGGTQCVKTDNAGVLSAGSCGLGSITPWTSNIDADGYDLNDLSNIEFRNTTGAPAGSVVAVFSDNTGDLNLNALTGKTVNLQINGTDEYNFSSTALALNGNNITGAGSISAASLALTGAITGATSYNGLVVTANTGVITSGTWNGTALTDAYVSDTLTSSLFVGSGSTTTAVDLATAEVAGTLPVNRGGTGAATLTGLLLGNGTSAFTGVTTSSGISGALSDETGSGSLVFATNPTLSGATFANGTNIVLNTTTGTKIGTATNQKLGFYNATPIVQPTGNIITALSNLGLVGSPTLPASSVSSGAALTKTDDTNVTLTLGGSPSTSLLAATSLTLGWSGQLSVARGGTGAATFASNGVLYGNGTGAIGATVAGTTGQCLVANTGSAPSWGSCGSNQTPWTSNIDADGYDLQDLSNIEFRNTTGAPAGSVVAIFSDNTGDLNLNSLTGKSTNIQVNGADEYNFSSTTLDLNGNTITNAGSYNGLVVTANTGVITSGTWNGTALTDAYVSDTLTSSLFVGSGSTTTAVDLATAEVAGVLPISKGGTGGGTFTSNGVLYGNGTSAIQATAQGGANTVLVANGGAPSFSSAITVGTSVTSPSLVGSTSVTTPLLTSSGSISITPASGGSVLADATFVEIGDISGVSNGAYLFVDSSVNQVRTEAQTIDLRGQEVYLGDTGSGNGTRISVYDTFPDISLYSTGTVNIGDVDSNGNSTIINVDDNNSEITLAADATTTLGGSDANIVIDNAGDSLYFHGDSYMTLQTTGTLSLGDISGNGNSTYMQIIDSSSSASLRATKFDYVSTVTTGTGTSSGFSLQANYLTTGTGANFSSTSLTSGSLVNINVASTAAASNTQKALNVTTSGANGTSTQTTYGGYFANTHTGTDSTNVAAYFSATGGTNNYAGIFENGNVGIGTATPIAMLDVQGSIYTLGGSGDTTGNGTLSSTDATRIMQYLSNSVPLTQAEYARADINGDGQVTYLDAMLISQLNIGGVTLADAHHGVGKRLADAAIAVDFNGNVGIGTGITAPAALFNVGSSNNFQVNSSGAIAAATGITSSGAITFSGLGTNSAVYTNGSSQLTTTPPTSGTLGYWSRTGTLLTPATSGDTLSVPGAGSSSEVFGVGATATGSSGVAIGYYAAASGNHSTSIGASSYASAGWATALGKQAGASGLSSTALGFLAQASGAQSTALGRSANAAFDNSIAIGYGATSTAVNQFVSGSGSIAINDVYFGNGVTNATPSGFTLNATGGSGTDIAGANITIASGIATGNAAGGDILFQTSDPGSSGTTAQTLTTKMTILANGNVGVGIQSPHQRLTVAGDLSETLNAGYFSTDSLLLSQQEGGTYFGRTGVSENQFSVQENTWANATSRATDAVRNWGGIGMSANGKFQTAVGNTYIYTSSDYGVTWTQRDSSKSRSYVAISSDGKFQTTGVNNEYLYTSSDYGETWTQRAGIGYWRDIAMSSDGKIQTAASLMGYIYTSTDYGVTWTPRDSIRYWGGVAMSSDGKIQTATVAISGYIYTSTDYGVTWTPRDSVRSWDSVAMSSDGKIQTALTGSSYIYTSTDYGVTWTQRASAQSWYAIAMSSDGKIQTAGINNGYIYTSTDYGATWTQRASVDYWRGLAMSSDGKIQAAATASFGTGYLYTYYASSSTRGSVGFGTDAPARAVDILDATNPQLRLTTTASSVYGDIQNSTNVNLAISGNSLDASSGLQYGMQINPTINQSSTAGYTALLVNATQTATGSGTKKLLDLQVGGASQFSVSNAGVITSAALSGGGTQCVNVDNSGVLGTTACGGALTPWTSNIDADGYDLQDLSNLEFRNTTGAPAGNVVAVFSDNSGDLNLNAFTSKSINLQVSGSDEYNFSSTALAMNGNNITGATSIYADDYIQVGDASNPGTLIVKAGVGGNNLTMTASTIQGGVSGLTISTPNMSVDGSDDLVLKAGNGHATYHPNGFDVIIHGGALGGSGSNGNVILAHTGSVAQGSVGIGVASSLVGKLHVVGSVTTSGANAVAGMFENLTLTNGTASGYQFGNRLLNTVSSSTAGTHVGQFIRMTDSTSLSSGQVVRGLEVQAWSGTNNNGINTGIATYGKTFGLQAETSAQAGGVSQPAAVFAYLNNASGQEALGNAIRAYTDKATSANLVSYYQETSAFTGNGLVMDFGNNSGSFSGNFISLKNAGTESFHVDSAGNTYVSLKGTQNTVALCHATNGQVSNDEIVDCSGAPSDVAEYFGTTDSTLTAAEVVVSGMSAEQIHLDGYHTSKAWIERATKPYQSSILGVISTAPAQVYGDEIFSPEENPRPVALVGRVPVKVTSENGVIKAGDYLTSSATQPGKAMKATRSGVVIGQALSDYNGSGEATVVVFVNVGFQAIGNTIVLDAPTSEGVDLQSGDSLNNTASTFTIQQQSADGAEEGEAPVSNILQLQTGDANRFMVSSTGATSILSNLNCDLETASEDCPSVLKVTQANTELMNIDARGTLTLAGTIFIKDDTFAGSVATDTDGLAEITFSYNLGTGKPVVQLTAEAQIPVFAQILEFKQDEQGNYTGFVIKTFDLISGPVQAIVHYNVTGKQAGYITLGEVLDEPLYSGFGSGFGGGSGSSGDLSAGDYVGGDGVGLVIENGEVVNGSGSGVEDSATGAGNDTGSGASSGSPSSGSGDTGPTGSGDSGTVSGATDGSQTPSDQ